MKMNAAAVAAIMISAIPALTARAQAPPATTLAPVDYTFIGLTYLGNRFQIDTGRLGETHASSAAVRDYAHLMNTSHVDVENQLVALLHRMGVVQPPASLLAGAYQSLVRMLGSEQGAAFDRDYVASQVDYQEANDALYRWELRSGSNAELKQFAQQVLPKIDDHLQRARALSATEK